jgi:glycerol-3-phosphate dehydrogenase
LLSLGAQFDTKGPKFYSQIIKESLSVDTVSVLMGANIATDVARAQFVESTLACEDLTTALALKDIFQSPTFQVQVCQDVTTVELCGAFKNVIAMGAGEQTSISPDLSS